MIWQFFDTMIVESSDKEWLQRPIEIKVLETVWSHLNGTLVLTTFEQSLISNRHSVWASYRRRGFD